MEKMTTIKNACPICRSDVTGNEEYRYLCKRCYVFFEKKHLKDIFDF